jgi:hypothetical protein
VSLPDFGETVIARALTQEEHKMNSMQESDVVLSVARGQDEQWHVTTQESLQPLASFGSPQSACAWALGHAKPKRGQVFIGGTPVVAA